MKKVKQKQVSLPIVVTLFGLKVSLADPDRFNEVMKSMALQNGIQELLVLQISERIPRLQERCYQINCNYETKVDELEITPLELTIGLTIAELFNGKWVSKDESPCVQVSPKVIIYPRGVIRKINSREFTLSEYFNVMRSMINHFESQQ